jgi:NADPH2:quinone reductase
MLAYVVSNPGGPEVLERKTIPDPKPSLGQVLIKIKALGLNRAEAVTRMGGSFDAVKFPKVRC